MVATNRPSGAGLASTLAACVLAAAGLGCGEPIPPMPETSGAGVQPLVTVTMSLDAVDEWELPEGKAKIMEYDERTVLYVDRSEATLELSRSIPVEAKGAGQVLLRVMCDGEYKVALKVGSVTLPAVDGGDTRREWRELMFPLSRPLTVNEGDRVTVVREPTKAPVLIEAIRFMP